MSGLTEEQREAHAFAMHPALGGRSIRYYDEETVERIVAEQRAELAEDIAGILDDPNGGPVEVGLGRPARHMHAEPVCAHPDCQTYLAPDRMALERIRARAAAEVVREAGGSRG